MPTVLEYEYYLKFIFNDGVKPLNLGVDHGRIDTTWDYVKLSSNRSISQKISLFEWFRLPQQDCYQVSAIYHVPLIKNTKLVDGIFDKKVTFWNGQLNSNIIEICL
jgi:hypothetical protein